MMDLIDFILHIDEHLEVFLQTYQSWIYAFLFLIIFVETGLVVMPFLPGDSLLFAAGMLAAQYPDVMSVWLIIFLLILAAFLGDTVNYYLGKYFGEKALNFRLFGRYIIQQKHILATHNFYEKYGMVTIIIARFVPFVRTFAPFIAGMGKMNRVKFLIYNLTGGILWIVGLTLAGYFLGKIPIVKNNFEKVVILIILISILPIIFSIIKKRFFKTKTQKA